MSTGYVNLKHSPQLDHEAYGDVLAATRAAVTDHVTDPAYPKRTCVESWQVEHLAAALFGHDGYYHPGRKFAGQVKRALNELTRLGALIKVGRGQRTPGGHYVSQHPMFYTPETFAKAEARAEQERATDVAEESRWARVSAVLTEQGFEHTPGTVGRGSALLSASLEAWEALADRLAEASS